MKKANLMFLGFSIVVFLVLAACGNNVATEEQNKNTENDATSTEESQNGVSSQESQKAPDQEIITLKVADSFPTNNDISVEGASFWMDKVEELTDGQVKFEYFPAEQLGKAASMLDLVKSKTTDIAYTAPAYISDKLPLSDVAALPGLITTSSQGGPAYWKVAQTVLLEEEFLKNGVRPVWVTTLPPGQVFTAIDKKIEEVEDFRGVKLRASGGTQELTINALGGVPVAMPAPELYTALERKTVDGGIVPLTSWKAYQLEQLAKYATTNSNLGSFGVVYVINEEVYQSLPDNVKEAMKQAGDETVTNVSEHLDQQIKLLEEEFSELGVEMYAVDDENLKAWSEAVQPVQEEWVQRMEDKGLAGQKVLDEMVDALGL